MKHKKLSLALALMAFVMIVGSAVVMADGILDTKNQMAVTTVANESTIISGVEIVIGPTAGLQKMISSIDTAQDNFNSQMMIVCADPLTLKGKKSTQMARSTETIIGNADITANSFGGNSSPVKNVFASAIVETNTADEIKVMKGSGGNFFHTGKILASNLDESTGMMTSIAT
ncbi:MAG: hypothetical protein WC682_03480 [Parcubacteria group bacterium]|jgi:hypothetical protein